MTSFANHVQATQDQKLVDSYEQASEHSLLAIMAIGRRPVSHSEDSQLLSSSSSSSSESSSSEDCSASYKSSESSASSSYASYHYHHHKKSSNKKDKFQRPLVMETPIKFPKFRASKYLPGITPDTKRDRYWLLGLDKNLTRHWQFFIPRTLTSTDSDIASFVKLALNNFKADIYVHGHGYVFIEVAKGIQNTVDGAWDYQVTIFLNNELRAKLPYVHSMEDSLLRAFYNTWPIKDKTLNPLHSSVPGSESYRLLHEGRQYLAVNPKGSHLVNCDHYIERNARHFIDGNDLYYIPNKAYRSPPQNISKPVEVTTQQAPPMADSTIIAMLMKKNEELMEEITVLKRHLTNARSKRHRA